MAMAMAPPQCAAELPGSAGRAPLSSVSASDAPASAAMGDPPPPSAADAHWRGHRRTKRFVMYSRRQTTHALRCQEHAHENGRILHCMSRRTACTG